MCVALTHPRRCAQALEDFKNEMAATQAAADHPNIVRLIGICEEEDTIYIVMDRAEGRCVCAFAPESTR